MKRGKESEKAKEYYELKTEAVEELVSALKEEPGEAEIPKKPAQDPYKGDRLARIPTWIKALFAKYWVAGAICYFGLWGAGLSMSDVLDNLVFVGVLTGAVTDLLVNSAFLYFETEKKEFHRYMMLPVSSKRIWTLPVNIIYALVVTFGVFYIYVFINQTLVRLKGLPEGTISLGVEPLLYGLFFLAVDMSFIAIKNLIVSLVRRAKSKAEQQTSGS